MNKVEVAEKETVQILCNMGGNHMVQRINALYTNQTLTIINHTNVNCVINKTHQLEEQLLFVEKFYQKHRLVDDGLVQFASQALSLYYQNLQNVELSDSSSSEKSMVEMPLNQLEVVSAVDAINRRTESGNIVKVDDEGKKERPNPSVIAREVVNKYFFAIYQNGFYLFVDGYYKLVTHAEIRRLLNAEYRLVAEKFGFAKFYDYIIDFLNCEKSLVVANSAFEKTTYLVAFHNGYLDTMSMQFFQTDYHLFFTSNINCNYLTNDCSCPNFDRFIEQIAGNDELLMQRIFQSLGYIFSNDLNAKAIFLYQGVTNSGKSTLIKFISSFFDEELVTALSVDELDRTFALSELIGKALCVDTELTAAPLKTGSVGKLKQLSCKDLLSSDKKYSDRVKFVCRAKIILATNHRFQLDTRDAAFLKRIVVLPFNYEIPKQGCDPEILQSFKTERLAIVKKVLYYYCQLRQNRYVFAGDFKLNEMFTDEAVGSGQMSYQDWVVSFLDRQCIYDANQSETTENLYCAYQNYCQRQNTISVDRKKFTILVKKIAGDKIEAKKERVIPGQAAKSSLQGIRLNEDVSYGDDSNKGGMFE